MGHNPKSFYSEPLHMAPINESTPLIGTTPISLDTYSSTSIIYHINDASTEPFFSWDTYTFNWDRLYTSRIFHLISLSSYILVLFNAFITVIVTIGPLLSYIDQIIGIDLHLHRENGIIIPLLHSLFILTCIILSIYINYIHYISRDYFPFTFSRHILFFRQKLIIRPSSPPNHTLYITQKISLLLLGTLFIFIPLNTLLNLLTFIKMNTTMSTDITSSSLLIDTNNITTPSGPGPVMINYLDGHPHLRFLVYGWTILLIIQLILTLYQLIMFILLYIFFTIEIFCRSVLFPCFLFRPRYHTFMVESDNHILASHISDPLFYKPYEFIYINI